MQQTHIKQDAGLLTLALRLVIGWTYFSAFWRRTVLVDKLDPELAGYIGVKFNHFLPHALGIKPLIRYLVENPDALWVNMVIFTLVEGVVGLLIMLGLFTRLMSLGVFGLAMGILLGSGWIGTTCLDEWQIGVLGISTGFVLFLTGSGAYSLDSYLMRRSVPWTRQPWFAWLGSGVLPIRARVFPRLVLIGSLLLLGMTLVTNQVFHGGVWGPLHNKSVKPQLEITQGSIQGDALSFDLFRSEGVDVYGAWIIRIELRDAQGNPVLRYGQDDLAALSDAHITNHYVATVQPGQHSLVVPLGAKATMRLNHSQLRTLTPGRYTLRLTDISGAYWEQVISVGEPDAGA